jgi:hypothetical protein
VARLILAALLALSGASAAAREAVEASPPQGLAVTLYRDPNRGPEQPMERDFPQGFAMISETRQVTLPPGESTVRFTGVAEGMVAESAIVTGLPGGTIEKNRNADLLSPAALVDGTLGNRVTVTRTNPATGAAVAESAIVRTRADGGLVLETSGGFEAVRCSGLPESLSFDRVPAGLSAQPVFSIDTRDLRGGTYTVQLTYLAWGFDWQAHYVATIEEPRRGADLRMRLMSWLTLLNDNGQSFPNAELLVVAGKLNVTSDYQSLSDPPDARPLQLTCFPLGSTAAGSPLPGLGASLNKLEQYAASPVSLVSEDAITVTGSRMARQDMAASAPAMVASEEQLGDLKLYRVPEPVTVSAKGLKQVAFLDRPGVTGKLLYKAVCSPWDNQDDALPGGMLLATVNDRRHGLGVALPQGGITVVEASSAGELLVAEERLRDYAEGQDVELYVGASAQVFAHCQRPAGVDPGEDPARWTAMRLVLSNANPAAVTVRIGLGAAGEWQRRGIGGTRVKDGETITEVTVPANGRREVKWEVRPAS